MLRWCGGCLGWRVSKMRCNAPLFLCRIVRRINAGMLYVKKCLGMLKLSAASCHMCFVGPIPLCECAVCRAATAFNEIQLRRFVPATRGTAGTTRAGIRYAYGEVHYEVWFRPQGEEPDELLERIKTLQLATADQNTLVEYFSRAGMSISQQPPGITSQREPKPHPDLLNPPTPAHPTQTTIAYIFQPRPIPTHPPRPNPSCSGKD